MDVCGVCGTKRSANIRFTKLRNGWVCAKCLKESAIALDYPDWQARAKVVAGMTVGEMKERVENGANRRKEEEDKNKAFSDKLDSFVVTTTDLHRPYEVISPIFFQTSNKGVFSSAYKDLAKNYTEEIRRKRESGEFSEKRMDLTWAAFGLSALSVGQNDFEPAFFIAVEELKKNAIRMGADAIVGFRMDFDLDTSGFQYFYLHVYGTAVKYVSE